MTVTPDHAGISDPIAGVLANRELARLRLKDAQRYGLSDVKEKFRKRTGLSHSETEVRFEEMLRFLVACSLRKDKTYGMKGPIDDVWHEFILFTAKYSDFCQKVLGTFVHHRPNTKDKHEQEAATGYQLYLTAYSELYGEVPNEAYWPCSDVSDCDDCETCGHDCKTS